MEKASPLDAARSSLECANGEGCTSRASASTDEIYLEHGPLLRRVAIRKFNVPPSEAEALVHDVFINCLLIRRNVRTNLRAYLVAAIHNACRNYWRLRRSENQVFAGDESAAADVATDDLFDGLALNLLVASTLAQLGERCREVLRRYYLQGEDTATIATAFDTTPTNVNYLMHVCRKRARAAYEKLTRVP